MRKLLAIAALLALASSASADSLISTSPRFTGTSPPSGAASGDLSGSYPNPTVSKVNGATPVYSVNGQTGAIAGVNTNTLSSQTLPFTITNANTPCGSTVLAAGPGTLTLSPVTGFNGACVIQVCNTALNSASTHGIILSGFPNGSLPHLWQQQCEEVSIENGAWAATRLPGKFTPTFMPSIYVDQGGNNANDGLISAAFGIADLNTCFSILQSEMNIVGGPPACMLTSGSVFTGPPITYIKNGTGDGVVYVIGNGGIATLRTTGNLVFEEYDFAGYIIFSNIQFDCSFAGSHPCYGLFLHQQTGTDLASASPANNPNYFNGGGISDIGIWCDSQCKINASQPVYFTGSWGTGLRLDLSSVASFNSGFNDNASFAGNVIQMSGGSQLLWSGALTLGASNSANQFLYASGNGTNAIFTTLTVTGSIGGGARSYQLMNNAVLCNASATALPGTAGVSSVAGAAAGIVANSGVSGTCTP